MSSSEDCPKDQGERLSKRCSVRFSKTILFSTSYGRVTDEDRRPISRFGNYEERYQNVRDRGNTKGNQSREK